MNLMIWIWCAAIVLFGLAEAATAGLVSIWFVVGAVLALPFAYFEVSIGIQLAVFLLGSAAALALTRPLVRKLNRKRTVPTNLDRVVGETARVAEEIDNRLSTGAVYVDGKTWTARSADGAVIPQDTMVTIERIEGVKLLVKTAEKTEVTV